MTRKSRRILEWTEIAAFALLSSHFSFALPLPGRPDLKSIVESPVTVRVRIAEAENEIEIHGYDLRAYEGSENKLVLAPDRLSRWNIQCEGGRVQLGDRDFAQPLIIGTRTGFLHVGQKPYRNKIYIYSKPSRSGAEACEIVNHVEMEKYLNGLVNAEFSTKWSEAAIEAQVVAARTYAYHQIREGRILRPDANYDVDATEKDQVYDGSIREDFRASRSVENTRGIVLTVMDHGKVEPLKAFYHSTCGGITELPEHVWKHQIRGFRRAVICPYCVSSPRYRWSADLTASEISDALLKHGRWVAKSENWPKQWPLVVSSGSLQGMRILERDYEGRVFEIAIDWVYGQKTFSLSVQASRFRDWVGADKLRSTAFEMEPLGSFVAGAGSFWHFSGRGFGHGVGMCQWGAKVMGERGFSMAAILKYYYPDADLRKLW